MTVHVLQHKALYRPVSGCLSHSVDTPTSVPERIYFPTGGKQMLPQSVLGPAATMTSIIAGMIFDIKLAAAFR